MADHITLYNYTGESNRISKTLSGGSTYSLPVYRDTVDFHDPDFLIEATISAAFNYCEIEQGGVTRYYFARVENVREGLSRIVCTLDPLMTFDVSSVPVIPARSSSHRNSFLIDTSRPVEVTVQHYNVPFSGGSNLDYNNLTMVAGIVGSGGDPTNL